MRLRKVYNINKKWTNREKGCEAKTVKRSCCAPAEGWRVLITPIYYHLVHINSHRQEVNTYNVFIHV